MRRGTTIKEKLEATVNIVASRNVEKVLRSYKTHDMEPRDDKKYTQYKRLTNRERARIADPNAVTHISTCAIRYLQGKKGPNAHGEGPACGAEIDGFSHNYNLDAYYSNTIDCNDVGGLTLYGDWEYHPPLAHYMGTIPTCDKCFLIMEREAEKE